VLRDGNAVTPQGSWWASMLTLLTECQKGEKLAA
jgi:hypothetical protein